MQFLIQRLIALLQGNHLFLKHVVQNILLTQLGTFRIDNRVIGRRSLRQSRQHGGFRQSQLFDIFIKIDLRGRRETISALTQINLIEIQLKDFILTQRLLDFISKQRLIELSRKCLFTAQIKILRHLLRNRTCTRLHPAGHNIANNRPCDTPNIHAPMLIKPFILGSNNRIPQYLGKIADFCKFSPLLPVYTDNLSICRINS